MKAFPAVTLLCSLLYFSIFTNAQTYTGSPHLDLRQQFKNSQDWWSRFVTIESLKTLGRVQGEQIALSQYVESHPDECDAQCQKQAKRLARQANHLCRLNRCEKFRGDGAGIKKNIAKTDVGDLYIIHTQSHLAIATQATAGMADAKANVTYLFNLLSIKDATQHLKELLKKRKAPRTAGALFCLCSNVQITRSRTG